MAGDFTGDGHPTWPSQTSVDNTVSVLLGNGDGTFQPQVTYAVGRQPDAIVAGDFTGDGHLDLAVAKRIGDNTVSVLLGNGDGTFQPQVTYAWGRSQTRSWRVTSPATAAPTWPSQTRATTPCRCCWATATARSSPRSPTRWGRPARIVAGDFTGDGRTDLAVANGIDNTVSVLLGNGDGTFQPQVTYAVGLGPGAIVAGDFTGDGRIDLAVANEAWHRHRVGVAGQRRRHVPAPGHLRGGSRPDGHRGG